MGEADGAQNELNLDSGDQVFLRRAEHPRPLETVGSLSEALYVEECGEDLPRLGAADDEARVDGLVHEPIIAARWQQRWSVGDQKREAKS